MRNSINPFDTLYEVGEINGYFGQDQITIERAELEIKYWLLISNILIDRGHSKSKKVDASQTRSAIDIIRSFDYKTIGSYLASTKHEIKALEYALREKLLISKFPATELIHWGLTSQDIVDPVYTIAIRNCVKEEIVPSLESIIDKIAGAMMKFTTDSKFPGRTHGQLAIPTTMHEQFGVYYYRLSDAKEKLSADNANMKVKFGGALGSLDVHKTVDPDFPWFKTFNKMFVKHWDIEIHEHTTQVNGNDDKARTFASLILVNNILIDFVQDVWLYFSYGYLTIDRDSDHVGSSTMAQKNNPIEFENVEGMLQHVNSELHFMMDKLTKSRGQRDLSDSVVQRFYGLMFAQIQHAYKKLIKAVNVLKFDGTRGQLDVHENAQIYSELLQCLVKLGGDDKFEEIKHHMSKELPIHEFMLILQQKFPELKDKIMAKILK